jgi:hypothetical protein
LGRIHGIQSTSPSPCSKRPSRHGRQTKRQTPEARSDHSCFQVNHTGPKSSDTGTQPKWVNLPLLGTPKLLGCLPVFATSNYAHDRMAPKKGALAQSRLPVTPCRLSADRKQTDTETGGNSVCWVPSEVTNSFFSLLHAAVNPTRFAISPKMEDHTSVSRRTTKFSC